MILATADRELRALADDLGSDAAVAERVGLVLDELIEAAEARTERLFWAVSNPNGYPGPRTHGALAGAWFHGALCAAVWRDRESSLPARPVGADDLMEAVQAFEAESDETAITRDTQPLRPGSSDAPARVRGAGATASGRRGVCRDRRAAGGGS